MPHLNYRDFFLFLGLLYCVCVCKLSTEICISRPYLIIWCSFMWWVGGGGGGGTMSKQFYHPTKTKPLASVHFNLKLQIHKTIMCELSGHEEVFQQSNTNIERLENLAKETRNILLLIIKGAHLHSLICTFLVRRCPKTGYHTILL